MRHIPIHKILARAKSLAKRRHSVTIYVKVAKNVYYDGTSYRVRVTNDYERTSKNFRKLHKALKFRDKLLQLT
jgi:hypothetical protein